MVYEESPSNVQSDDNVEYKYIWNTEFSIYVEMAKALKKRPFWKRVSDKSERFHLLLGDRWQINYARLIGKHEYGMTQMVNYFKGSHQLTLKAAMVKRLREHKQFEDPFSPESYILVSSSNDTICYEKTEKQNGLPKKSSNQICERTKLKDAMEMCSMTDSWIAKPSHGSKGTGILISNKYEEIVDYVESSKGVFVVQRYISKPMLIGGRKFDIRCWVLLAPPNLDIYLFNQGSLRTASKQYSNEDLNDVMCHLTNHCIQQKSEDFGKYEKGNEMWYHEFKLYLHDHNIQCNFDEDIIPQIKNIIKITMESMFERLRLRGDYMAFQLFGFDFMIDDSFKVWLLEVNGSPASADKFYTVMVEDIIRVVIDPQYPPPPNYHHQPDMKDVNEFPDIPRFEKIM
eukprot:NODE_3571_length_1327_cov_36.119601_g3121_i0.p1 GENE.NODE_3571_length_1327_cov_36.119601_g3121_i0~~NODE_3571_length_1327_cov_36.119601_g3121_i0.p1  ORF type:complete len:400 (+),score=61.63 NODE_3571_length_1327_cov_36.119601_g3121_i0:68-1267(+)